MDGREAILVAKRRLVDHLERALTERAQQEGLVVADVVNGIDAYRPDSAAPSAGTLGRYRRGVLPTQREWGRHFWEFLDSYLEREGTLLGDFDTYRAMCLTRTSETHDAGSPDFPHVPTTWVQSIPNTRGRAHSSVDEVTVAWTSGPRIGGSIIGISDDDPTQWSRKNVRWTFTGVHRMEGLFLFLIFESITPGWESSNGTIALQLVQEHPRTYKGQYTRVVPTPSGPRIKSREVEWKLKSPRRTE